MGLGVQPDHVHMFAAFPPTLAANHIMHRIQGATRHPLRQAFPELDRHLPSLGTRDPTSSSAGEGRTTGGARGDAEEGRVQYLHPRDGQ